MIELDLAEYFASQITITDRVGTRIYPGHVPTGVLGEVIVLQEITSAPEYGVGGECGSHDKLVQIDCYAESPRKAFELAETVRLKLSGYRGTIGDTNATRVDSCRELSSGQERERPTDRSDKWIHRYRMDFALFAEASIPTFA